MILFMFSWKNLKCNTKFSTEIKKKILRVNSNYIINKRLMLEFWQALKIYIFLFNSKSLTSCPYYRSTNRNINIAWLSFLYNIGLQAGSICIHYPMITMYSIDFLF